MALLGMGIKSNALDYLMVQAPREIVVELVKAGLKIASFAYDPGISAILRMGIDEAKKDVIDWLVRNEIRVGGGNLHLASYNPPNGEKTSANFPFILTYSPKNGEIEIVIYSPNNIKPPKSQGSFSSYSIKGSNFWNEAQWLQQGKTHLSPFTVKVSGKIEKGQHGGYLWKESPNINIDLHSPVPKFEFKPLSVLDRQLLSLNRTLLGVRNAFEILSQTTNRTGEAGRSIWDRLRSGILNLANMGGAAVSSFFFSPNDNDATIVSLQDEVSSVQKILKTDNVGESNEVRELKRTIARLESELKISLQKANNPSREETKPAIATTVVAERVEINRALIDDLTRIIHIGPARAREIVRLRPFSSLDDLIRVPGIGVRIIADIKNQGLAYVEYQGIEENAVETEKDKNERTNNSQDPCLSGRVDINSASLEDLIFLRGIGPAIAQRIIDHRRSSPFNSLDDLGLVRGIGTTTVRNIRNQGCAYVRVISSVTPPPVANERTNNPIKDPCLSGRVDINSASLEELDFLTGIGPAIAQRIIEHRRSSPFNSLNDLELVGGIGPTTVRNIKNQGCAYVRVISSVTPPPATEKKPKMDISEEKFSFLWDIGEELPDNQSLTIQNKGDGPLNWTLADYKWVSFVPNLGTILPGEAIPVILTVDPTELIVGEHSATILIESNCDDSPHEIEILLSVLSPPKLARGVVISEVKINEREFIELYNPTEEEINMTEWQLSYYSSKKEWNEPHRNWKFPTSSVIQPNSYFLIGVYEYPMVNGNPNSDWKLLTAGGSPYDSGQLSNSNGSLVIFSCESKDNECRIDAVGWGETLVREGEPSAIPKIDESISRRKNSQRKYIDNEDNSTDFVIGLPRPTNSKGETNDILLPEAITDFTVKCQDGGAILEWTTPSDLDTPQELLVYEIRYYKKGEWKDGVLAKSIPEVSTPGEAVSFLIDNLNYGINYYFGLITLDTRNQSPLSNIVSCTTEPVRYESVWTGFQGNSQRSGRVIEALSLNNSEESTIEVLIEGEGNSDHINDPIIIDGHGSVYFTGQITIEGRVKRGFLAFNRDGEFKWHYEGPANQFSIPVLLPDGGIFFVFQGALYEKSNLMKINRDGTINWSIPIQDFYPIGPPAVSNNGRIHLFLLALNEPSGKLKAIESSDGSMDWEYKMREWLPGGISPAIDENGSIYFSLQDTLYSISHNGELKWTRTFPFIPAEQNRRTFLSNPTINNGVIYLSVLGESEIMTGRQNYLYALDPNNPMDELWKAGPLGTLQEPSPVVNYNGDVFLFGFSDPVFRIATIFGYNNKGGALSGWPISISSGGMLKSMVVDANNNLYGLFDGMFLRSFDINGKARRIIGNLNLRRNQHLSIDKNGNVYLGGDRYLYRIK